MGICQYPTAQNDADTAPSRRYTTRGWRKTSQGVDHAQNYVRTPLAAPHPNALPFGCTTEVWYEDMEAFKAFAQLAMSEKGKVIFDLEGTFMDTSQTVAVLVKETGS